MISAHYDGSCLRGALTPSSSKRAWQFAGIIHMDLATKGAGIRKLNFCIPDLAAGLTRLDAPVFNDFEVIAFKGFMVFRANKNELHLNLACQSCSGPQTRCKSVRDFPELFPWRVASRQVTWEPTDALSMWLIWIFLALRALKPSRPSLSQSRIR